MFSMHLKVITVYAVALPVFGLCFAIFWALIYDFKHSTSTHCHVSNYLPTVSASISRAPQSYVWNACIALHTSPRYAIAYNYWWWYSLQNYDLKKWLFPCKNVLRLLTTVGNIVEISALLALSLISSTENFTIHATCFTLFIVGQLVCMTSMCLLHCTIADQTYLLRKSIRRKKMTFITNVAALLCALYSFYRHNTYCEPGVYTIFALFEYIVIISNMMFHYSSTIDFNNYSLSVVDSTRKNCETNKNTKSSGGARVSLIPTRSPADRNHHEIRRTISNDTREKQY